MQQATPFSLIENLFYLDGNPISLPYDEMRHLLPIYNTTAPEMLLMFGRQTHKSTTVGNKLVLPALMIPSYRSLYVAPTALQASVFSNDKLNGTIYGSPIIEKNYTGPHYADQVGYKELKNGSKIYLRSAFRNADSIRGISADHVMFDEVQDIIRDNIPVIRQCMGHSMQHGATLQKHHPNIPIGLFNNTTYAGTPKTMENTLTFQWARSSQNEFLIRCTHCNKLNYIDEQNIGPTQLECRVCHRPIWYQNGKWVQTNPNGHILGFRLPQIVLPWINNPNNPDSWKINVINTQYQYSVEKYYNEVLALPYANAKHPVEEADIRKCCISDLSCASEEHGLESVGLSTRQVVTVAGIDWGKGDICSGTSYSVLTIGAVVKGVYTVLLMKRYSGRQNSEAIFQLQDMIRLVNRFGCKMVIADTGDGRTSNAHLVKALGPQRFCEIYESGNLKAPLKWDTQTGKYVLSRTQMMTNLLMEITRQQVRFFRWEEFASFSPDFTGIFTDYSEKTRLTQYDHNVPDDAFHSYMYSRIAAGILRGEYDTYLGGSSNYQNMDDVIDFGVTDYNVEGSMYD